MVFQKHLYRKEKKQGPDQVKKENSVAPITFEELHQITMEMSWGCGILSSGYVSEGLWYFD